MRAATLSRGQTLAYQISNTAANQAADGTVTWGVRYNNPALSADAYTGSLRVTLWAVSRAFSGNEDIQGYRLFTGRPNFSGIGARSSDQLYNFYNVSGITSSGGTTNPPAGAYCIVAALDMYDPVSCSSSDQFCYADWAQFGGTTTFP